MKSTDPPIIVEQLFNKSIKEVWGAITELDQMKLWFFDNIPDFKPEIGFKTKFNIHNEGRDFLHLWKITEVNPMKKIVCNWKFQGYNGESNVTFELIEENGLTKLILTNTVVEDFPDDIPEFKRESCIGGWQYFIQQNLKNYLEE